MNFVGIKVFGILCGFQLKRAHNSITIGYAGFVRFDMGIWHSLTSRQACRQTTRHGGISLLVSAGVKCTSRSELCALGTLCRSSA